jgi:hypothetical protein
MVTVSADVNDLLSLAEEKYQGIKVTANISVLAKESHNQGKCHHHWLT